MSTPIGSVYAWEKRRWPKTRGQYPVARVEARVACIAAQSSPSMGFVTSAGLVSAS
jgi:tetrahydromethanopterin S-methyltransferase subunit A